MAINEDEPYIEEALSTLAMCVVATWTVSTGAYRSLSMRLLMRESGETQPVIDEKAAMMLPIVSSFSLLVMYFLFKYIQVIWGKWGYLS